LFHSMGSISQFSTYCSCILETRSPLGIGNLWRSVYDTRFPGPCLQSGERIQGDKGHVAEA
jgi:hypothetical protein